MWLRQEEQALTTEVELDAKVGSTAPAQVLPVGQGQCNMAEVPLAVAAPLSVLQVLLGEPYKSPMEAWKACKAQAVAAGLEEACSLLWQWLQAITLDVEDTKIPHLPIIEPNEQLEAARHELLVWLLPGLHPSASSGWPVVPPVIIQGGAVGGQGPPLTNESMQKAVGPSNKWPHTINTICCLAFAGGGRQPPPHMGHAGSSLCGP